MDHALQQQECTKLCVQSSQKLKPMSRGPPQEIQRPVSLRSRSESARCGRTASRLKLPPRHEACTIFSFYPRVIDALRVPIAQPLDSQQLALRLSLEQWREELEAESKHFPSVVLYVEHKLRETFAVPVVRNPFCLPAGVGSGPARELL
jgi:hypothetical protein